MAFLSRRTVVGGGLALGAVGAAAYAQWPRMDAYLGAVERQRRRASDAPLLGDLVRMACLAANGHNVQPWKFRLGEAKVSLLPDFGRRTPVVDPDDHHLFVSLGCATENLAVAAAALGRASEVEIAEDLRIDVALAPAEPGERALYEAIPLRQSTRSLYDGAPISPDDLALLQAAARREGVAVRVLTDSADKEAILDVVVAANSAQIDDPAFVRELLDWLRFSPARALATGDGLFSACSGNPVAPDWMGRLLFGAFFTKGGENDRYRDQIRSSAGIAVFTGAKADPAHWVAVGRSFERFALQATALGIRTAHLNQPVEVASVRSEFAGWLGAADARPDLVVRFGRGPALPMSLRRPVRAVLV